MRHVPIKELNKHSRTRQLTELHTITEKYVALVKMVQKPSAERKKEPDLEATHVLSLC